MIQPQMLLSRPSPFGRFMWGKIFTTTGDILFPSHMLFAQIHPSGQW